jgi:hypothetical protein
LLQGGKKAAIELRVSSFDLTSKVTPIRFGPDMLHKKEQRHSEGDYTEQERGRRECPA